MWIIFAIKGPEKLSCKIASNCVKMRQIRNRQIREQMCLEAHFQYENSVFGRFGQSGLQRKKHLNCHKYATFEGSCFYVFIGKK
jgi:hypothetical protein